MAQKIRVSETAQPTVVQAQATEATRRAFVGVDNALQAPSGTPSWNTTACSAAIGKLLICDTTAKTFAVTLPSATQSGSMVIIKVWGSTALTIHPNGSDTIDNSTVPRTLAGWAAIQLIVASTGKWIVVAGT